MADESNTKKGIFRDVRFFLADESNEKVKQVLKSGGAAREFYISDLVTHVIAKDTKFPQFSEAKEYNLIIVKPKWVFLSVACNMLLPGDAFRCESQQLFKGIVVCPSKIPEGDRDALWAMVTYHGGQCQLNLNPNCTHLIIPCPSGAKYDCALEHPDIIKIVTPSWIIDSIKENKIQDEAKYAPCIAETKTQTETSSLLTPDDNDRTTTTPLSASIAQETSTPVAASSKMLVTLPSTLLSPVSPLAPVTVESKVSTSISTLAVSENSSTKIAEHTFKERRKSLEDKENVADGTPVGVKIGENNNEVHANDKEKKAVSKETDQEEATDNKGSNCLTGCVFMISDYQDCMDHDVLHTWMEVIELHGGSVSPFYGKRCTHLLCLNQHGSMYQQALSDGKKIVTAHWLNDVLLAKTMFAPSNALHFPVPFKDKVSQCRSMVITVTGYAGKERTLLKNMIFIIGARYTGYLTRSNTHIICKSPSGEKYSKAREWGIHCVNAKWLGDIVTTGYPSPCNLVRYSTLGVEDELQLAKDLLVRELIIPWQTLGEDSNASHQQATNNGKRKLEEPSTCGNVQIKKARTTSSVDASKAEGPKVLFTGITPSEVSRLTEIVIELGGTVVASVKQCTHLVTRKIIRTVKFLCAISIAHYVVTPEWIDKSQQSKSFLDARDYIVKDSHSEDMYDMELTLSLQRARACPLLKGISVYVTQNVEPSPSSMKEIILCAGGQVLASIPSQQQLIEWKNSTTEKGMPVLLVISCEKDVQLCADFIKKGFEIHNAELILSGVLKQQLDFDLYKL